MVYTDAENFAWWLTHSTSEKIEILHKIVEKAYSRKTADMAERVGLAIRVGKTPEAEDIGEFRKWAK